jgi:hypothetical protein
MGSPALPAPNAVPPTLTPASSPEPSAAEKAIKGRAEFALCGQSFLNLLKVIFIMEPPPLRGKVRFEDWAYLIEVARAFTEHRQLVVLKARQVGFSWLVAAYVVWWLRWREGSVVLLLSKGQVEAYALLQKVKFIYRNLPQEWQLPLTTDSRSEIQIGANFSKVIALPSTEDAGRGETSSLVVQDEGDFHDHLEQNLIAVEPTVSAGGQIIVGSTSNKKVMISPFKEIYRNAPQNGWHRIFIPWHARPGRDQAWYERTRASIPATTDMTPDLYMEQEFPGSDSEALAPSAALSAFTQAYLRDMELDCREPVRTNGPVNIYREWRVGGRYMCGTDTSHGVGADFSASVLIEAHTGYVVADILDNLLSPDMLAWHTMQMLAEFRNPIWAIEDNEWGEITIKAARAERYPRLYHRQDRRGGRYVGWHADERSRYSLWAGVMEAIHSRALTVPNRRGLDQFNSLIRNPKKNGRIEAMTGAHDDYPTAVGIALQAREQVHSSGGRATPALPARW